MKTAVKPQVEVPVHNMYMSAIREFVRGTINDPSFFTLPPEQQKQEAMKIVQQQKLLN